MLFIFLILKSTLGSIAEKVSKYGVFSGPFFHAFGLKKLRIWTLFTQWEARNRFHRSLNTLLVQ